jgi:hypothetical protein
MDTKEARRIQSFLSEFDVESEEKGALERAEDVLYGAAEQRHSFPPAAETRDGFWLHLDEGPGIDLATSEIVGVESEADLQSGEATLSPSLMVSAVPVDSTRFDRLEPPMNPTIAEAAPNLTNAETAGVEIDFHAGTELEADHKVMSSARVKNVRTVESIETNCARADEEPTGGFDSTLATVVGTDSIADVAAHVHGVQADAVGQVSNKRKARQNATKSKHQKERLRKRQEIGDVVSQTEEGAKDWGDRTNSKFVHDLNTLLGMRVRYLEIYEASWDWGDEVC